MRVVRTLLAPIFWLGRVTLWIVFFPLGPWRSIVHSHRKSDRRQEKLLRELARKDV
jgi:hypothetical protein